MADLVSADVFKFTALRAPTPTGADEARTVIRDSRITVVIKPDDVYYVADDVARFDGSPVAKKIFEWVKEYLEEIEGPEEIPAVNAHIADNARQWYGLDEWPAQPWIDEFVAVIRGHLDTVSKRRLIRELTEVLDRHLEGSTGLLDYVLAAPGEETSRFCDDYDALFDRLYALYVMKRAYPVNLEYVMDGLRALHVIGFLVLGATASELGGRTPTGSTVSPSSRPGAACAWARIVGGGRPPRDLRLRTSVDLAELFGANPYVHRLFASLLGYYRPFNYIRPVGVGDLLVVKQFLCEYAGGEIAHVENVLKGEDKQRTLRVLDRNEEIVTTESEKSEETQRDLTTTDRFELATETQSTIQTDLSAEVSGAVSGKYGTVEYSTTAGVSFSTSTNEARRSSNNFAKDIVDRSLTKLQTRTRDERVTRKTHEVEDSNKHQLTNVPGTGHVTGIYRWLDKHYKAQVFNYGRRLMFEFVIPEPAAFITAAFEYNRRKTRKPDLPQRPAFPALDVSSISEATVNRYAALYELTDLEPMPADQIVRSLTVQGQKGQEESFSRENTLEVDQDYEANEAKIVGGIQFNDLRSDQFDIRNYFAISVGHATVNLAWSSSNEPATSAVNVDQLYTPIGSIATKVAIGVVATDVLSYALTVTVKMKLTAAAKRKWQLRTYQRIMDAYDRLENEYQSKLTAYEDKLAGYEISQGVRVAGRNPGINQQIIRTELKKHCITMLAKQFDTDASDDVVFDSMRSRTEQIDQVSTVETETTTVATTTSGPTTVTVTETTITPTTTTAPADIDIPAIDIADARDEGRLVQFLEQAFEWQQITYLLYPYFWGRLPEKWFEAQTYYDEEDPLYGKFLQAGSVRVLIAVQPAFEQAVMHYLATREPWNGGPAPGLHDPLYRNIADELREQQDDLHGATPYGDSWPVVVPTALVYLQEDATLPEYDCDVENL